MTTIDEANHQHEETTQMHEGEGSVLGSQNILDQFQTYQAAILVSGSKKEEKSAKEDKDTEFTRWKFDQEYSDSNIIAR